MEFLLLGIVLEIAIAMEEINATSPPLHSQVIVLWPTIPATAAVRIIKRLPNSSHVLPRASARCTPINRRIVIVTMVACGAPPVTSRYGYEKPSQWSSGAILPCV